MLLTWPSGSDDAGDGQTGTPLEEAYFDGQKSGIEALVHSLANPTISPAMLIDEVKAARGSTASLSDRLANIVDAAGQSKIVGALTVDQVNQINALPADLAARQLIAEKDQASGYVGLDASKRVGINMSAAFGQLCVRGPAGPSSTAQVFIDDGTRFYRISTHFSVAWNGLVQSGDHGFIFSDGSVDTGALVVGPWTTSPRGLRMTAAGAVGLHVADIRSRFEVAVAGGAAAGGNCMIYDGSVSRPAAGSDYLKTPLVIMSNPSSIAAGQNGGLRVNVADQLTATPSAGDLVAATIVVGNTALPNATGQWALNSLSLYQTTNPTSGSYIRVHENEIAHANTANIVTDPFGAVGANQVRANGIETIIHSGSAGKCAGAYVVWANNTDGSKWWSYGLAISRTLDVGVYLAKLAGDSGTAFGVAGFYDASDSATVLKCAGTHTNLIDISGMTAESELVKLRTNSATGTGFRNYSDFEVSIYIDSGVSAAQTARLTFRDRGTAKFYVGKNASNAFIIQDQANARTALQFDASTALSIYIDGGLKAVSVGAADSGAAGFKVLRVPN